MGIADFVIKLTMETAGVSKGSEKAKAEVNKLASSVEGSFNKLGGLKQGFLGIWDKIGGFKGGSFIVGIAAAIKTLITDVTQRTNELIDKAKEIRIGTGRTGLDNATFQRASNVFERRGSSTAVFETSLEKTADAIQSIREGQDEGAKAQTAFARLGITLDDIKKKNHQEVFFEIAANLKNAQMSAEKIAALKDIFGKNAGELIPVFKEGFNGKAANAGLLSDEQIARMQKLGELKRDFALPYEELTTKLGATKTGAFINYAGNAIRHPLMAIAGMFSNGDDLKKQQDKSAAEIEAQTKQAEADAKEAAQKKERDKARDLSLKNATKLDEMRISALGKGAQEIALKKRSAALLDEIRGTAPGEDREKLRAELLENEEKLASLKPDFKGYSLARPSDALSKIGLFRGGAEENSQRIWTQQLEVQRLALSEQRRTVQRLDALRNDLTSLE